MRILIRVVTVLVIAVVVIMVIREIAGGPKRGDSVLPQSNAGKIMRIEISSANSTAILERTGESWKAASLYGYPAKTALVEEFIQKLTSPAIEATISGDQSIPYDTEVKLLGAKNDVIGSFSLGDVQEFGSGGRAIRLNNGKQYVSSEFFDVASAKSEDWVDRYIINLPNHAIEQISVVGFRSEYSVLRINDEYQILGMSEEIQVNKAMAKRMFGLFEQLQFESVADPNMSDEAVGLAEYELITVRTRDGFDYVLHVGTSVSDGNEKVIRVQVQFRGLPEPSRIQAQLQADREFVVAEGEQNSEEARVAFRDKKYKELVEAHQSEGQVKMNEAKAMSAKLAPWRFKLSNSIVEQMMPTPDQLLQN